MREILVVSLANARLRECKRTEVGLFIQRQVPIQKIAGALCQAVAQWDANYVNSATDIPTRQ